MLSGGPSSALGPGFPARLPPFVSCGRFSFVRTPFFCRLLVRFSRPGGLVIRPEPEIIFTFVQTKRSMKVLYTALLALLLFPSCRRQSGDIDSFLHNAESLMNEHPEDALSIIRHIDRRKIYSSASEARYALLYSQALDKNYVDVTSDSLTAVAVNYYDRHGTKHERAMAHYYQGRVFSNAGNFDAAIRSYSLAEDAASGTDDYYLLGLINNAVGNLHFEQYDLDEALQRDQQAASFFHRAQSPYNEALAYIGVGTVYSLKGDNEQMEIVYNKAIEIYKELNATDKILPLYEDIIIETKLNTGIDLSSIKRDLRHYYTIYNNGRIPIQSMGLWQGIYLKANELDSARLCGEIILRNRQAFNAHKIAGCYSLLERIEMARGNYPEAYRYVKQYIAVMDSINQEKEEALVLELEQKYRNRILNQSYENLKQHNDQQRIITGLVLLFSLSLLVAGLLYLRKWRENAALKMREAEAEKESLGRACRELQEQLGTVGDRVDTDDEQERQLFDALEERMVVLRNWVDKAETMKPALFMKSFRDYMTVNVKSKHALSDLQYVVNRKYFGVVDYLKAHYPELRKQDLDLCCLLCFGFSQHGICYLYTRISVRSTTSGAACARSWGFRPSGRSRASSPSSLPNWPRRRSDRPCAARGAEPLFGEDMHVIECTIFHHTRIGCAPAL